MSKEDLSDFEKIARFNRTREQQRASTKRRADKRVEEGYLRVQRWVPAHYKLLMDTIADMIDARIENGTITPISKSKLGKHITFAGEGKEHLELLIATVLNCLKADNSSLSVLPLQEGRELADNRDISVMTSALDSDRLEVTELDPEVSMARGRSAPVVLGAVDWPPSSLTSETPVSEVVQVSPGGMIDYSSRRVVTPERYDLSFDGVAGLNPEFNVRLMNLVFGSAKGRPNELLRADLAALMAEIDLAMNDLGNSLTAD